MARFSRGASGRSGRLLKRSRNASDTASLSSWGSEANVLSDGEEVLELDGPKKHRSSGNTASAQHSGSSSDDDSAQSSLLDLTRGKRPKCFSRNAVLARQNRLKKKKYVEDLESELQTLRKENSKLKVSLNGYSKDVELVRKENVYLRNVLSNSKEISQLIRSINVNCGLPVTSSVSSCCAFNNSESSVQFSTSSPQVVVQCANPANSHPFVDSCIPSANPRCDDNLAARTVKRDYPIAADDVSLSLSAPNDDDDLEILFGTKAVPLDMDLNLNEAACEDSEYLGFGPNALGDWLDGEEPSSHIGVCLHVANQKVSLEFCSKCNENAFSSWNSTG